MWREAGRCEAGIERGHGRGGGGGQVTEVGQVGQMEEKEFSAAKVNVVGTHLDRRRGAAGRGKFPSERKGVGLAMGWGGLRAARIVWLHLANETKYVWDPPDCTLGTQASRAGKECEDWVRSAGPSVDQIFDLDSLPRGIRVIVPSLPSSWGSVGTQKVDGKPSLHKAWSLERQQHHLRVR